MEDLQEKYDELDNIEMSLRLLTDDITIFKEYKEDLLMILYDVQKEKEEIEPKLLKENDEEKKAMEKEYWNSQF